MSNKSSISDLEVIGYDLDGTCYPSSPKINDRIRTRLAEIMLEERPSIETVPKARTIFEKAYERLKVSVKVFRELGYDNPEDIVNRALATADVLDLIEPNLNLVRMLKRIDKNYTQFLLTSRPKASALAIVEKLGIDPKIFRYSFFSDDSADFVKVDGTAYGNVLRTMGYEDGKKFMYVGDKAPVDVIPAKKYGMTTVLVSNKPNSEADYVIKKIEDLEKLLFK